MSDSLEKRLSKITTNWDELRAAHEPDTFDRQAATLRCELLQRYSSCAHRYILGATKNPDAAEDLTQEFALRFVRGDFRNANPQQGRFRDYLKKSLRNLITDFFRARSSKEDAELAAGSSLWHMRIESLDSEFSQQWREQVLSLTWKALKQFDAKKNQYYEVLHLRASHPDATSDQLAELFSATASDPVSGEWIRQNLHRARRKFSDFLVEEVGRTVGSMERNEIDEELAKLGLQKYVDRLE